MSDNKAMTEKDYKMQAYENAQNRELVLREIFRQEKEVLFAKMKERREKK